MNIEDPPEETECTCGRSGDGHCHFCECAHEQQPIYQEIDKEVKDLIDTKSSFADWLTNKNVRAELNQDLFFLLIENGYPPEWNDEVFDQVLDQVENYKTYN